LLLVGALSGCTGAALPAPGANVNNAARTLYVATNGSDSNPGTPARPFRTIQHGLDVAVRPGDTVVVRAGRYAESINFRADGTSRQPIVLKNYPRERPFIAGAPATHQKLVRIFDRSHIRFEGFEVGDLRATMPTQSGAIFVEGYGDDVAILDNDVHDVEPAPHHYANGRAIQVRGFYAVRALTNVLIAGNSIERCAVQDGNVLEVSGNSTHVRVLSNRMRGNRGIALNITGGTHPPAYTRWRLQVADVVVAGNTVEATAGSGSVGIYIQASRSVDVRMNRVTHNAWGLYVTSEYPRVHSRDVTIADNVVTENSEAGILVGSPFFPTVVLGATATGNTVLRNGANESGNGGNFGIGRARNVEVRKNRLVAADDQVLTYLGAPYTGISLDDNCYDDRSHDPATAEFQYAGTSYVGFNRYRSATGQDRNSAFARSCAGAP